MEITNPSGPPNEYFSESHFLTTPNVRGDQNVYPGNGMEISAAKMNKSRKGGRLNLRKSLAWNPSFFTEEGVLDPSELSKITGSVTKPNSRLPSKTNVERSSMVQFDEFSKRPPLNNLEGNLWSKLQSRSISRSREKKATKLSSISKASSPDGSKMSMALQKSSMERIPNVAPKLDVACLTLEKRKTEVMHSEKGAIILPSNYRPSPSNRLRVGMNSSAPTTMMPVVEKVHKFCVLPHAPGQAKLSALRMPSSQGRVEKSKITKSLFVEGPGILKRKSCSSSSNKSPTQTSFHDSSRTISSFSQQTFYDSNRQPVQMEAKPSALRIPSPSLGFFQQKTVTSSHSGQLHKTSQVPISAIISMTSLRKPNHLDFSKPSIAKTDQQSKEGTVATTINVYPGKSRSTPTFVTVNGSNLTCTDSEAHTENMEIEHIDTKGTSSSNVCRSSNCLPDAAKETRTNCLSKLEEKTREVFLGKTYTGKTEKLHEEICSTSQISSSSLIEGCGMIGRVQCSDDFESTGHSIQYSIGTITTEMHLPQNLDESKSKKLYDCAPFMNGDLIIHKDSGDKPDMAYVDTSKEKLSYECSDCVSNLRSPCISSSEISGVHAEPRKELSEEVDVQNNEEHLHKIISQVQQAIFTKTPTREECFNSSLDAQLILSGGCQPQDDLQLRELRNESCLVDGNVLMPDKKITLDNLKQDAFLLKHRLSYVPYSEEWLAAIEAFGEDAKLRLVQRISALEEELKEARGESEVLRTQLADSESRLVANQHQGGGESSRSIQLLQFTPAEVEETRRKLVTSATKLTLERLRRFNALTKEEPKVSLQTLLPELFREPESSSSADSGYSPPSVEGRSGESEGEHQSK